MRIIYTLLITAVISCFLFYLKSVYTIDSSKWYSRKHGFINIEATDLTRYPLNCIKSQIWKKNKVNFQYEIDYLGVESCMQRNQLKSKPIASLQLNKNTLTVNSLACLPEHSIKFEALEDAIEKLKYDRIYVEAKINGKRVACDLFKKELDSLNQISIIENDFLSINQQLWVLFESGMDHHSESIQDAIPLIMKIYHRHGWGSSITFNTMPCYLKRLRHFIFKKLQDKELNQ